MKTIFKTLAAVALVLAAVPVRAELPPTIVVGNSGTNNLLVVSKKFCKLYAVTGQNLSGATEYIQVFQMTTNPIAGNVPVFSVPVPASPQFYSFDFSYYGADSSGCVIAASTTATSLTFAAPGNQTIQAIIGGN